MALESSQSEPLKPLNTADPLCDCGAYFNFLNLHRALITINNASFPVYGRGRFRVYTAQSLSAEKLLKTPRVCWGAQCSRLSGSDVSIGLAVQTDLVRDEVSVGHKVTAEVLGTLQTLMVQSLCPRPFLSSVLPCHGHPVENLDDTSLGVVWMAQTISSDFLVLEAEESSVRVPASPRSWRKRLTDDLLFPPPSFLSSFLLSSKYFSCFILF